MSDTPTLDDDTIAEINNFREEVDNDPDLSETVSDKMLEDGIDLGQLAQDLGYDLSNEDFHAWMEKTAEDDTVELHDFELAIVAGGGGAVDAIQSDFEDIGGPVGGMSKGFWKS